MGVYRLFKVVQWQPLQFLQAQILGRLRFTPLIGIGHQEAEAELLCNQENIAKGLVQLLLGVKPQQFIFVELLEDYDEKGVRTPDSLLLSKCTNLVTVL